MSFKSLGNPSAQYSYRFGKTGKLFGQIFSATGGVQTTDGLYTIHTFSYPNTDSFIVTSGDKNIDFLLIAGGGGCGFDGSNGIVILRIPSFA